MKSIHKLIALLFVCVLALVMFFNIQQATKKAPSTPNKSSTENASAVPGANTAEVYVASASSPQQNTSEAGASSIAPRLEAEKANPLEIDSHSAEASSINPQAAEALKTIFAAADAGDMSIIRLFTSPEKLNGCVWCKDMFRELANTLTDPESSDGRRFFATQILGFSENLDAAKQLVTTIKSNEDPTRRSAALDALARMNGTDEIIDFVISELDEAPDDQTRESLVAMLGYQHSLPAAKALYEDLVNHNDPEAYAAKGFGFVIFKADQTAIPYLREKAALGDQYSAITLTSLLESGEQGGEEALVALNQVHNQARAEELAQKAAKLVRWRNPESWLYLRERLATETDANTARLIALLTPGPSPR